MTQQQVISYYESTAHENEVELILARAKKIIQAQQSLQGNAIVLDIDETALNHYYSLKLAGFPQDENHSIWNELLSRTDVYPIKATLDFYLYCLTSGLKVFFISARFAQYLESTKQALRNAGYVNFEDVFVFPENIEEYNSKDFNNFKAGRRAYIESLGYKILISIGDQSSDLLGGYTLYTLQLPNYLYGENSRF
ncbi:acid phosphatase [Francisella tularensis subsp. novicida]|uniref:HAD family acid phosphatase n=1 Tax=Francisella tularensis TaxID=263 RepID=UPI0008FD4D20|nr:HAD family acid phosphatase [Francisella tularensis]APC94930.1 HAD super, subIIIB family protein [Francisella tularensis subsp. novicida]MBK2345989.1 acid phosphatase [Francisella tularensis subsp. novicida]